YFSECPGDSIKGIVESFMEIISFLPFYLVTILGIPLLKLSDLPSVSTKILEGMLFGRFLVGTGMGVGPSVASLYVTEVSPSFVRGTYGSFIHIATCLGLMLSLLIRIPAKEIAGCLCVATAVGLRCPRLMRSPISYHIYRSTWLTYFLYWRTRWMGKMRNPGHYVQVYDEKKGTATFFPLNGVLEVHI
ncbi:hypothetical protein MKX03_020148, partial [Papaver bracteatum]